MTALVRFLLVNLLSGLLLGLAAGFVFIVFQMEAGLLSRDPIGAAMLLWSFGASFAMGSLSTGLGLLASDR